MEFYHLRSFVAVAQTGNLTQAAKRLYTTPPAISAHIKTLEEELSNPLFIRSSKGMSLTDKGQYTDPVDHNQGTVIMTLLDKISPDLTDYTSVRDSVYNKLLTAKQQELYGRWFETLVKNSDIQNFVKDAFTKEDYL